MERIATPQAELARENAELTAANRELRSANESLVFAAARYLALHDLAPVPLVTVDSTGIMVDLNDAAGALLGAPRGELLGQSLSLFLVDESRVRLAPMLAALFADARRDGFDLTLIRGAERIEISLDAIVLPDRGPSRAVLACVDVTQRKRADAARERLAKRAEEAQRLESLGVLAGGIAHDFNNLMTVVMAGTDTVLRELSDNSPYAEPLVEAQQAARRAGDLAHQMLTYSGHVSVPTRPVCLSALIRELEPLIRTAARSIPVVLELEDRLPNVAGNDRQLRQVILNLVSNAAEAMADRPGVITISAAAEQSGASVVVEVRDAGLGMEVEVQAKIFDPFFSTKFAGRGLGLSVVQGVVRGHGGTVTVSSVAGIGATFGIHLPAARAVAEPATAVVGVVQSIRGTVLLVDDDELVRRVLARGLQKLELTVLVAQSGDEALQMARDHLDQIDLVLTDLTMPGMNGVELAHELRGLRPELPVVLISGYGILPAESEHLFAGAIAKPFGLAVLSEVLLPLLEARAGKGRSR